MVSSCGHVGNSSGLMSCAVPELVVNCHLGLRMERDHCLCRGQVGMRGGFGMVGLQQGGARTWAGEGVVSGLRWARGRCNNVR